MVDDERMNETYDLMLPNIVVNDAKVHQLQRDIYPYIMENFWFVETPSPYLWTMWQPWIKGYHGEVNAGYANWDNFQYWIWYDQELKEEMGH